MMLAGVGLHRYDMARRETRGDIESIDDRGSEMLSIVSSRAAASSIGSVAEGAMLVTIDGLFAFFYVFGRKR